MGVDFKEMARMLLYRSNIKDRNKAAESGLLIEFDAVHGPVGEASVGGGSTSKSASASSTGFIGKKKVAKKK